MYIVAHRGASGLELENTKSAFIRAIRMGVDAVEFDVRRTKDKELVVSHDPDLVAMAGNTTRLEAISIKAAQSVPLLDGSRLLTFKEALMIVKDLHVIVELKERNCINDVLHQLKKCPPKRVTIASFHHDEAALLKQKYPHMEVFLAEHTSPFEIIQLARKTGVDGLDLNFWLLNPLTYWLCHRLHIQIMVYTVNRKRLARFIARLYPNVWICTDHPEWFMDIK